MENLFFSPWSERENNSCASLSPRAVADSTHMWRSLIFGTRISILLEIELVVNYRMRKFCHLYCLFNVSQAICKYHIRNQQCAKLTSATRRNNGFFFRKLRAKNWLVYYECHWWQKKRIPKSLFVNQGHVTKLHSLLFCLLKLRMNCSRFWKYSSDNFTPLIV